MSAFSPLRVAFLTSIAVAMASAAPSVCRGQEAIAPPEPPEPPEVPSDDPPRRDYRPLAVFGVGVGAQALGLVLTLPGCIADGMSDRTVEISWAIYMGVAPALGTAFGALVARSSPTYDVPLGSMFAGAYLGAALAYVSVYFFMEHDDPKVDGSYDGGYFGESNGPDVFLGILTMGLASLILPAAGMAIIYAAARDPQETTNKVAFEPPVPIVFPSARPDGPKGYGISFLRGTF